MSERSTNVGGPATDLEQSADLHTTLGLPSSRWHGWAKEERTRLFEAVLSKLRSSGLPARLSRCSTTRTKSSS